MARASPPEANASSDMSAYSMIHRSVPHLPAIRRCVLSHALNVLCTAIVLSLRFVINSLNRRMYATAAKNAATDVIWQKDSMMLNVLIKTTRKLCLNREQVFL